MNLLKAALTPFSKRYCEVRYGFLCIKKNVDDSRPVMVLTLIEATVHPQGRASSFVLSSPTFSYIFRTKSVEERRLWVNVIRRNAIRSSSYRFDSFAPVRNNVNGKYFVGGSDYFDCLLYSLDQAKRRVFIADWSLSPMLYLKRGKDLDLANRLDNVLKRIAEKKVF